MSSDGHTPGVDDRLDPWVHSVILGAEAEFGEKPPDQQPIIRFSPVGTWRALGLSGQEPEQVHRRDAHVQVEVELLLAAGLAVGQSRVLFGVSDHKLDLVAQAIVPNDLVGVLTGMCGGEDNLLLSVGTHQQYNPKVTPKVGTVSHCRQDPNLRVIRKTADFIEPVGKLLLVAPVNFAVVLLWRTGAFLRRARV